MPKTPELRAKRGIVVNKRAAIAAARAEREAHAFDLFMRTTAVASDPDGEHLWLLVEPKGGARRG